MNVAAIRNIMRNAVPARKPMKNVAVGDPPLVTPPSCDTRNSMKRVSAIRNIMKNAIPSRVPMKNAAAQVPALVTPPSCDTSNTMKRVAAIRNIMRNAAPSRKPMRNAAVEVPPLVTPPSRDIQLQVRPPRCDSQSTFILHRLLGEGGFGQVFLATHSATKKIVAIKSVVKTSDQRDAIETELKVMQKAEGCPFLTQLHMTFQSRHSACFAMEYVSGGDLFDFTVKYSPLPVCVIRFIAAEISCGLEFLHERGIVHRDIKRENILLDNKGHVRIADYGLAVMDLYGDTTVTGVAGTIGYMAPEVINGDFYQFEPDWFSMGVVIYIMATGTKPFCNRNTQVYRKAVSSENPVYPPDMDQHLKNFIDGLLCKCPDKRLGVGRDIRRHLFMRLINWKSLEQGKGRPPFSVAQPLDMDKETTCRLPPSAIDVKALEIPGRKIHIPGFLNIDRL
ncbi:protein kinase C theta type-like [Rana temporaria]|uniref:protein kinase C theta type-like n=1 Tax=Rana temporaria TaxID=8407 RepID=UPI001AAC5DD9|nr:protein kinase C theta type-like [Rana temporaria]